MSANHYGSQPGPLAHVALTDQTPVTKEWIPEMNEKVTTIEAIAEKINFRGDYVLLVKTKGSGTGVSGGCKDAVETTRLIANSICEDQLRRLMDDLFPDESHPVGPDVAEMEALIENMRYVKGETFIICYCAAEDGQWRMAWSHRMSPKKAYREMMEYVRQGCP